MPNPLPREQLPAVPEGCEVDGIHMDQWGLCENKDTFYYPRHLPALREIVHWLEVANGMEMKEDPLLHVGDAVEHRYTGRLGRVTGFAHDGTTDVIIDGTGPYPQKDLYRLERKAR